MDEHPAAGGSGPDESREGSHEAREIVVRIRRRPPRPPWSLTRVVPWSLTAVAGDPVTMLLPAFWLAALLTVTLALGAPARAEVVVPLLVPPPADMFQDIGIVELTGRTGAAAWVARAILAIARTAMFAVLVAAATQRARGESADLPGARRAAAARMRTLAALGAIAFVYALLVSGRGALDPERDAAVAATALAAGMLVLPGAFAAAIGRGSGAIRALRDGLGWPRPFGHAVIVLGYSAAVNGLYRLASFGEPGRPRALPLALYALVVSWLTAALACALSRRGMLLRRDERGDSAGSAGSRERGEPAG